MEPKDLIKAGKELGLRFEEVPKAARGNVTLVNLWLDEPGERYPLTTICWPDSSPPFNSYAWGPRYEHTGDPKLTAEQLAHAVKDTLPALLEVRRG